jgi:hypothetical protein
MLDYDNGLMFDEANGRVVNATTFSFDFDNTISRDPEAFLYMMNYLQGRGHNVIVCTARLKEVYPEDLQFLIDKGYKVYWSEHKSKDRYLRSIGINVDVWIDDCPDAVLNDFDGQPRTYRDMGDSVCEPLIQN